MTKVISDLSLFQLILRIEEDKVKLLIPKQQFYNL